MRDRREALRAISGGHGRDRRHVSYSLGGPHLDPDDVTRVTRIEPGPRLARWGRKAADGIPQPEGVWILESGRDEGDEFHDQLDAFLARLRPLWATFVALGQRYEASVEAAIYLLEAQGPLVQVLPDVSVCARRSQRDARVRPLCHS